jgi:transcriptional regulator with XRE-family HTH domain
MSFKEQLTKLRKRNNMTQTHLAKLMDVKQYVISSWEIGRSEPTISQLKMLSNIFKISVDYLLDKEFIGSCNEEEYNNAIKNVKMDAEDEFLNEVIKECGKLSEDKKKKMLNIIKASLEFEK